MIHVVNDSPRLLFCAGNDIMAFLHRMNISVSTEIAPHVDRSDMGKSKFTRFTKPGFTVVPPEFEPHSIAIHMHSECSQEDLAMFDWDNRMVIDELRRWMAVDQYFSISVRFQYLPTMKRRIAAFAADACLRGRTAHMSGKQIEVEAEGESVSYEYFYLIYALCE
jgi:hypothetical protein